MALITLDHCLDVHHGVRGTAHSPCSKHGLPSNVMALITSDHGRGVQHGVRGANGYRARARVAIGETVISLTPPSPSPLKHLLKGEGGAAE